MSIATASCAIRSAASSRTAIRRPASAGSSTSCVQRRVEEDAKRAERLTAPLRPESDEDDVSASDPDVERGGLAVQVLLANQVTGQQRRPAVRVAGEHNAVEPIEPLE